MNPRVEKYARTFADRLIEALKAGTAPWQKPWKPGELCWPVNCTTGRRYRGNNAVLLLATALTRGWGDMRWAGFGQIRNAGGMVRKGEKGTPVLVWRERRGATAAGEDDTGEEESRSSFFATVHYVFNAAQADGLDLGDPVAQAPPFEPHAAVGHVADDAPVERFAAVLESAAFDHIAGAKLAELTTLARDLASELRMLASEHDTLHLTLL